MTVFGGRFLIGSYLQVSLMICFRELQSQTISKSSWNCAGQTISLECPENAVISNLTAMLGYAKGGACQSNEYCRVNTDPSHMKHLKSECNGRQKCSITATKGKISCSGWYWTWSTNFEYITFNCHIKPVTEHTTPARRGGTESGKLPTGKAEEPKFHNDQPAEADNYNNKDEEERRIDDAKPTGNNVTKVIVVVTICAILILIAIISLVVITSRRKMKKIQVKAVEMSADVVNAKIQETNANTDPKCDEQDPLPPSGNSSSNNRKKYNTSKKATHSPPSNDYEPLSIANHALESENPYCDLQMPQKNFKRIW